MLGLLPTVATHFCHRLDSFLLSATWATPEGPPATPTWRPPSANWARAQASSPRTTGPPPTRSRAPPRPQAYLCRHDAEAHAILLLQGHSDHFGLFPQRLSLKGEDRLFRSCHGTQDGPCREWGGCCPARGVGAPPEQKGEETDASARDLSAGGSPVVGAVNVLQDDRNVRNRTELARQSGHRDLATVTKSHCSFTAFQTPSRQLFFKQEAETNRAPSMGRREKRSHEGDPTALSPEAAEPRLPRAQAQRSVLGCDARRRVQEDGP